MLAALVTIPLLIAGIGIDRFAVLALAWVAIGYFSLFDLGLSRAMTHIVADRLGVGDRSEVPELIWTGMLLMSALGIAGGILLAVLSPWLVRSALNVPLALQSEALRAFLLLAFGLPWVISAGGLRGVLEAYQRFDIVNAIRVPTGVFSYLAPLLVLPFDRSLPPLVAILVVGRLAGWAAHYLFCRRAIPEFRWSAPVRARVAIRLVRFGGWMTVSNIISPLMTYSDRFVIGGLLPVAAVAFYVTPYEVATKLWLIPAAVTGVIFPALATARSQDGARASEIFDSGVRATVFAVLPIVLVLSTFAPEALDLWLGPEFSRESAAVLRWLAAGVLVNSVGQVAGAAIQGSGRPDLTAKLHMAEFPLYVGALWWLVGAYGVVGAAVAWTLRVAVDTVVLLAISDRLLPGRAVAGRAGVLLLSSCGLLLLGTLPDGASSRATLLALAIAITTAVGWRWGLDARGRASVAALARRFRNPAPSQRS